MVNYLILAHNEHDLFKALVKKLLDGNSKIFVHLDLKANLFDFEIKNDRVVFIDERFDCKWGGVSIVRATNALLTVAYNNRTNDRNEKYVLLSGQCYPIKSISSIEKYLVRDDKCVIRVADSSTSRQHSKQANGIWFFNFLNGVGFSRLLRKILHLVFFLFVRKPPIKIYHGSQWWVLNNTAVCTILTNSKANVFESYCKLSLAPDEFYFHSILANFLPEVCQFVKYDGKGVSSQANIHVIDESLAKIFSSEDCAFLLKSEKLFVRKLTYAKSLGLIERLNEVI